ncbi:hypothetical protein K6T82_23640 [Flavobacterium sp. 17A]|uniref:Tetratricopeptide repeat-containing protein n=1 Tax=Flavobacterium potami TaxID=2872310 RepID=A0A9X1HFT1_9FLAO|nr:tetratricopeptide repeat-containing sensor histidine kinase [Flavobacterium potami]MBZ4037770.1 hypothetical protein [Flavobacterium potami]
MRDKADSFWDLGKNDSAIYYFNKAQLLCNPKTEYADDYVGILNNIAEILQRNGDFYETETILTKTFPYLDHTTNVKYPVNTYTFMAYNYYNTYDYESALHYHKKALKKAISTFRKSRILSEIAFVYITQKRFQEAVDILEPISKYRIEDKITPSNTDMQQSALFYNLGLAYLGLENHKEQAYKAFNKSMEITIPLNDDYELIANYYSFYLYYLKYDNPELTKINIEKAYNCAKKTKSVTYQVQMLACLIGAENAQNSKKYWKIYSQMTDSLSISTKKAKNQFADIIYNSKKDKEENIELKYQQAKNELNLQRQKNTSFISYVIIFISVLVLLFLAYYITHKGRKEKNDAVFKSEMRISDKLHNELTKEIYEILSFAENNELENIENKDKFLYSLNNIYSKTRSISRENSAILTDDNYSSGLKEMISGYTTANLNIIINGLNSFSWSKIDRIKKITVYRVLQEIFDSLKNINNPSLASLTFKKDKKNITITYADNSREMEDKYINLKKRLQNVENRIKTIKGTLNFDEHSENGFKISFTFPI